MQSPLLNASLQSDFCNCIRNMLSNSYHVILPQKVRNNIKLMFLILLMLGQEKSWKKDLSERSPVMNNKLVKVVWYLSSVAPISM